MIMIIVVVGVVVVVGIKLCVSTEYTQCREQSRVVKKKNLWNKVMRMRYTRYRLYTAAAEWQMPNLSMKRLNLWSSKINATSMLRQNNHWLRYIQIHMMLLLYPRAFANSIRESRLNLIYLVILPVPTVVQQR